MIVIEPSAHIETLPAGATALDYALHIELAGRTCYKSEDRMTEGSAEQLIQKVMTSGHHSVIEHAAVTLELPKELYSYLMAHPLEETRHFVGTHQDDRRLVSGNMRAWSDYIATHPDSQVSAGVLPALRECCSAIFSRYQQNETFYQAKRVSEDDPAYKETEMQHHFVTARFIVDRGVTHELVRHRLASFSQESTRYCNYAKGKFGKQITVIRPFFWKEDTPAYQAWYNAMLMAEQQYLDLEAMGAKPQESRSVLPNSLKAEIVMTTRLSDWHHFFTLRTDTPAHPQMRQVTIPLLQEFQQLYPGKFDMPFPVIPVEQKQ